MTDYDNLTHIELGLNAGTHIAKAVEIALRLAVQTQRPVTFRHSGISITANFMDRAEDLVARWAEEMNKKSVSTCIPYWFRDGHIHERQPGGLVVPMGPDYIENMHQWYEANPDSEKAAHFSIAYRKYNEYRQKVYAE